jgi:hypothetical protein
MGSMYKKLATALQEIRIINTVGKLLIRKMKIHEKQETLRKDLKPILLADHDTIKQLLAKKSLFPIQNKSKWSKPNRRQ